MIHGSDVDGLIRYLFGPGRANEHDDPRIIDGWRPPETVEPHTTARGNRDLRPLIQRLHSPTELLTTSPQRYVWHVPISAARSVDGRQPDRQLTDAEFGELARDIVHRTGIAPRGDDNGCRWVLIRHGGNHAHLVATLARQDGRRCDPHNDWLRIREACRDFEDRHPDLRKTRPADRTADKIPSRQKTEKATRLRHRVSAMESLQREAYAARACSSNPAEFLRHLANRRVVDPRAGRSASGHQAAGEGSGALVQVKARVPGRTELVDVRQLSNAELKAATGYALHRTGDVGTGGRPIYYRGGALGEDLSIGQLKEHWRPKNAGNETAPKVAAKVLLRRAAVEAAQSSGSWEQYAARLREQGIVVKERFSTTNPGEVTGYSVGLKGHCDPATGRGMVAGSALKDGGDLSYQRLQAGWAEPALQVGRFDSSEFDPGERVELLREAAQVCGSAAERLRELRASDPGAASDAASSAADVLHAAAKLIEGEEGGPVTEAARSYGAAAREPYRAPSGAGPGGRALRLVARSAFFLRSIGDNEAADQARLVVSICTLIRAVGDIRQAQARSLDHGAALHAGRNLDRAIGIQATEDEWWKQVKRKETLDNAELTKAPTPAVLQLGDTRQKTRHLP